MYKRNRTLTIFLFVFFVVTIIFPFIVLCSNIQKGALSELLSTSIFKTSLLNSCVVTSVSTIIAVLIAYMVAYTLNRTNIRHKEFLSVLFTLPMLIPSISHGIGFINLFGTNGLICNLDVFGFKGIVMGSVMYSFPTAFLMFNDGLKYIDNSLYENAKVLGMNKWEIFYKITFPHMKKTLLQSTLAVFTLIFTDYGVPLTIGGKYSTLPTYLYSQVLGQQNFSNGTIIGLFLLIPAFISFIVDVFTKDHSINDNVVNKYQVDDNKVRDVVFATLSYLVIILMGMILASFVYMAFVSRFPSDMSLSLAHFQYLYKNKIFKYVKNSLIISSITAVFGTIIAYLCAFVSARSDNRFKKLIHILSIISMSIPGIVLGLAYILAFKKTPLYHSFAIIIICSIVHFISSPYLLAYNALNKVNKTYEDLGVTYKINSGKILFKVLIPVTKNTILEMFSYFFVNSMMTISAVSFLYTSVNKPLSLLIGHYNDSSMFEETAIISLVILLINLVVKMIVYFIKRVDHKRRVENEFNA